MSTEKSGTQLEIESYQLEIESYQLEIESYQLEIESYQLEIESNQLEIELYQHCNLLCIAVDFAKLTQGVSPTTTGLLGSRVLLIQQNIVQSCSLKRKIFNIPVHKRFDPYNLLQVYSPVDMSSSRIPPHTSPRTPYAADIIMLDCEQLL